MSTTSKAIASARELVDLLKKEVAATLPVVTESNDSDGHPVITLSADATPAAGEKVVVIRVKPIERPLSQDILGNAGRKYSNHVYQICTEANYEGTDDNILDILGPAELLPVIVECGRRGSFVEWYVSDNGTVPATAQMTAANLKQTWRDLYWNVQKAI